MKIILVNKLLKASRSERLTAIIRRYIDGRLDETALKNELAALYNRADQLRSSSIPEMVTSHNSIYNQVLDMILNKFPVSSPADLRPDQIDSYANTISARAVTHERIIEYQKRGTQYVQVLAYLDDRTTEICRSMHGRIFEIGPAHQSINTQGQLVQPNSFWQGNHNFSNSATTDFSQPWLPPYHYNCRTVVVPYIEPSEPYEAAMARHENMLSLHEKDIQAILNYAATLEFEKESLMKHFNKHKEELEVSSPHQMIKRIKDLLNDPLKQMGLAISNRNNSLNLYVWNPKVRKINNRDKHDFAVFGLDKKRLITFHLKAMEDIINNLDPDKHGKVTMLTKQYVSKGVTMVDYIDVKQYEYILDYFEDDDATDEQEMFSRFRFEREWDTIEESLKQRILAVDKIVLEKYAGWFNYNVFNDYIKCIKNRQKIEAEKTKNE